MQNLQIHWRGTDRSEALEEHLVQHAEKLSRYHPKVQGGVVTVRKSGHDFAVHVDFTVPGAEFNITQRHEDPYAAANNTFAALERSMKQSLQKQRGQVKHHGDDEG